MFSGSKQRRTLLPLVLVHLTSLLHAETGDTFNGFIAAGIATVPQYEGSDDQKISPLVVAQLEYRSYSLEILGNDLRAEVSPFSWIEFGPTLSFRSGRDNSDIDNVVVREMREIDDAFEGGAFVQFPFRGVLSPRDRLSLGADISFDLSDTYDGYVFSFGASYNLQVTDALTVGLSLGSTYASEDYNQTYFGIDADNAERSGLPLYEADAGLKDIGLTFRAQYMITEDWGVLGVARFKNLLGDAADSPMVDQEGNASQFLGGVGILYEF